MKRLVLSICLLLSVTYFGYGQNYNSNINQNTVVINNQPVIEKKEYITKYRTIYVDKPEPKRYARKLAEPVCLLNYLWVYPEDLGSYPSGPDGIIYQINQQGLYGRNSWRVPTDDELRLMENYAEICGLGDDIYLSTSHRNGILRLVSTGLSVQEQNEKNYEKAQDLERWREQERLRKEREAKATADRIAANHQIAVSKQNNLVSSGAAVICGGLLWATSNKGADRNLHKGIAYTKISLDVGWRLPTESEFLLVLKQSTMRDSYFSHSSGLILPFGTYAIKRNDGTDAYIILPSMIIGQGSTPRYIRQVQNKIY